MYNSLNLSNSPVEIGDRAKIRATVTSCDGKAHRRLHMLRHNDSNMLYRRSLQQFSSRKQRYLSYFLFKDFSLKFGKFITVQNNN